MPELNSPGIQVRHVVVAYLETQNPRYVFGVPGSYILGFYDALLASERLEPILTKHEQGAAIMADAYAKIAGTLSCCCGTAGPGATNLLTGVGNAYMGSSPVFVLTGQVPTSYFGKGALQEGTGLGRSIDQQKIYSALTKFTARLTDPAATEATMRKALERALSGRPGPVHLGIPIDVLNSPCPAPRLEPLAVANRTASPEEVERAAKAIAEGGRAAILAGAGALFSDSAPEILRLAEGLGIPVATTMKAKGIVPEDHPLSLGCAGLYGANVANAYLRDHCDTLIAIGASFHEFTTECYDEALAPRKALIQLDADPAEIGKNYPAEVGLVGNPKANLQLLLEALDEGVAERADPPPEVADLKRKFRHFDEPASRDASAPIKPPYLMTCLRRCLPRDAIVFSESITWTERYLPCYGPKTHIAGTGLAPIGYALPASVGGKLAAPDRMVVGIAGDGGFHLNAMELLTAVNYGVPVKWIVLDNGRFASIHDAQSLLYEGRHVASEFRNPDFVALAQAFGATGVRIEDPRGLEDQLRAALALDGPVLIDVVVDPESRPPFKPASLKRARDWKAPLPDTRLGTKAVIEMLKER